MHARLWIDYKACSGAGVATRQRDARAIQAISASFNPLRERAASWSTSDGSGSIDGSIGGWIAEAGKNEDDEETEEARPTRFPATLDPRWEKQSRAVAARSAKNPSITLDRWTKIIGFRARLNARSEDR